MEKQLKKSGIPTKYVKNVDLSWAREDLSRVTKKLTNRDYILVFPFCSKKHNNKKWPYFKELISSIRREFKNNYSILVAPGPGEIEEANKLNANVITDDDQPINIKMLIAFCQKKTWVMEGVII